MVEEDEGSFIKKSAPVIGGALLNPRYEKNQVFFVIALSHSDFSWAYWSAERIVLAFFMKAARLSLVQPAFMHSFCHATNFEF
jgi:hypothetical protein